MSRSRFVVPEGYNIPPPPAPTTPRQKLSHALPLPFHLLLTGISTVTSVATTVAAHLIDGPVRESWNLTTSVMMTIMRSSMLNHCCQGRHSMTIVRGLTDRVALPFALVGARGEATEVSVNSSNNLISAVRNLVGLPPLDSDRELVPRKIPAEWVVNKSLSEAEIEKGPTVLFLHGGAHIFLSPRTHRGITSKISLACRARVLSLDYRLCPENPFPAAIEDAIAAYCALIDHHPKSHKFSATLSTLVATIPSRVIVMGDSSGGCLTLQLLQALKALDIPLPAAAVLLSPITDHSLGSQSWSRNYNSDYMAMDIVGMHWVIDTYCGHVGRMHPMVSPVFADLSGLPPLLIQAGEAEVLADDAMRLHATAVQSGISCELELYRDMFHVFHTFPTQPNETSTAFNNIANFTSRVLHRKSFRPSTRAVLITCTSGGVVEELLPGGDGDIYVGETDVTDVMIVNGS